MKKTYLLISLLIFVSYNNLFSQKADTAAINTDKKYNYNETILMLVKQLCDTTTGNTLDGFKKLAYGFEQVTEISKDKWYPYYYEALCWTFASSNVASKEVDQICDKADELIKTAESLSPNNSEILCAKALILSSRIRVDIPSRGQKYSKESNDLLYSAIKLDPNNPRAFYLLGKNKLVTPAFWGGGKENAKEYFIKAAKIYREKNESFDSIEPHWGIKPTMMILKSTYQIKM